MCRAYCGAVLDYNISDVEYNTLGQLFKELGLIRNSSQSSFDINPSPNMGFEYYKYPICSVLNIKIHNPMIRLEKIHKNYNCWDKKIYVNVKLDPEYNYLIYSYSR